MAEVGQGLKTGLTVLSALRNSRNLAVWTGPRSACVRVSPVVREGEQGDVYPWYETRAVQLSLRKGQHEQELRSRLSASDVVLNSRPYCLQTRVKVQTVRKPALHHNGLWTSSWSRGAVCIPDTCRSLQHQQQIRLLYTAFVILAEQHGISHGLQTLHQSLLTITRRYSRRSDGNFKTSALHRSRTAYYDILNVSPSATQSQIKTAYYKQSLIHHPDKNPGNEEAARRFADISEAYTVLSNSSLRRKYDQHILSRTDINAPGRASSTPNHQQRTKASQSSQSTQKIMFDFDAFYQGHYGDELRRARYMKAKKEYMQQQRQKYVKVSQQSLIMTVAAMFFLAGLYMFYL